MTSRKKGRRRGAAIAALLLLSLIWAWGSLRADLLPSPAVQMRVSPLIREAMLLAIFASAAAVVALISKGDWPRGKALAMSIVAGLGLFAVPAVRDELGRGWLDDSTRVALFSLVPVFAIVCEPHLGTAPGPRGGFAAALIAVAGSFLVFPVDLPRSLASGLALVGVLAAAISIAAANCLAVRVAAQGPHAHAGFAVIASGVAALSLAAAGLFMDRSRDTTVRFDAWASLDLVALALLFWLMKRMTAVRMTTRFLIAPLLANLIGLAFLRPHVQLQAWLGLALIALGAGWILFAPEGEPAETGSPLGIG